MREFSPRSFVLRLRLPLDPVQSEDVAASLDCYLRLLVPLSSPKLEEGRLSPAARRGETVF
jgi:hypothetical protein